MSVHRENHQTVGIRYYKIELCFVILQAEKEDVRLRGVNALYFLSRSPNAVSRKKIRMEDDGADDDDDDNVTRNLDQCLHKQLIAFEVLGPRRYIWSIAAWDIL